MKKILAIFFAFTLLVASCTKPEKAPSPTPSPSPTPTPTPTEQITIPSTIDVNPVVSPDGGDTKISFTAL